MTLKSLTRADYKRIEALIDDRPKEEINIDLVEGLYEGTYRDSKCEGWFEHRGLWAPGGEVGSTHWKRLPDIVGEFSVSRTLVSALTFGRTLLTVEQIDDPTDFLLYHWKATIRDPEAKCQVAASHVEIGAAIMLATMRYLIIVTDD